MRIHIRAMNEKSKKYSKFFIKGKGYYAEGDMFWAFMVPMIRKVVRKLESMPLNLIKKMIVSTYYEERLCGVLILVEKAKKANEKELEEIVTFYLTNRKEIKGWDIVEHTAHRIVGRYLYEYKKSTDLLYEYARSEEVWKREIAILSTYWFIKNNSYDTPFTISQILLRDSNVLIQKNVGTILGEIGKRDIEALEYFLMTRYKEMHRVALRKAIYMFSEEKRMLYMKGVPGT